MKKILICLFVFLVTSCTAVNGYLVSEKKDGWFNGIRVSDVGRVSPFSFLNPFAQRGFMYCKSNDNGNGLADPVCYRVRYSSFSEEKNNYVEMKSSEQLENSRFSQEKIDTDLDNEVNKKITPTKSKNKR